MIRFTVPGKPRSWQRTGGAGGRRFTRPETRNHKRLIAQVAAWSVRVPLLTGPLSLEVVAVFARPQKRPDAVSEDVWVTGERCWRPGTEDADNIAKMVMDALNRIVWEDDRQVVSLTVRKLYAAQGEEPCTAITITETTNARPEDRTIPAG